MAITHTQAKGRSKTLKENASFSLSLIDYDLINFVYSKIEEKCGCFLLVNETIRYLFFKEPMMFLDKDFIITKEFLVDLCIDDDGQFSRRIVFTYNPEFYLDHYRVNNDTLKIILNEYLTIDMLKEYELQDLIQLYDMYSIDKSEEQKKVERVYIEYYSAKFKMVVFND